MRRKTTHEEAEGLSQDDLCDFRPTPAYTTIEVGARVALGKGLEPNLGARHWAAAPSLSSETIYDPCSSWTDYPEILLIAGGTTVEELPRRKKLSLIEGAAQYHDSELGDVYDLYNACNGVMSGELLDLRKLDELTLREREALDIERLREVWEHTATGCSTCAEIIRTLNTVRGKLRGAAICADERVQDKGCDTTED